MCLQQEFAKVHNKLHHYALVEVIKKKQIWIISFGVRMKKMHLSGANPAKTGQTRFALGHARSREKLPGRFQDIARPVFSV
jgi:hypothetical protein